MGKYRNKLKGQTKGKRWPKGQSGSSNPDTRKYRDIAKSRFFQENLESSNLTSAALQKHDAIQSFGSTKRDFMPMDEEDSESCTSLQSSYRTIQSFASDWSHCSSMSFNRFLKVFSSDSALHKEMLAILAAITDVIKQNNGSETPTEYFCLLVTTLEQLTSATDKNEDQITAALSLLNMGIKTTPVPVIRTHFSNITAQLLSILNEYSNHENNVIVKSILGVLSFCLGNLEIALWTHSETKTIFAAILNPFCIHTKPKWRKAAHKAVIAVISADVFTKDNFNPAADCVGEFIIQILNSCLGSNSNDAILISSIQGGQTTILHTLVLLKDTIVYFNKNDIKTCCEIILRLMSLNYPIVTSCGLQVLHNLFSSQKAVASAKLNGQIITALYDYQPSPGDIQPTQAWLTVMQQAHVHLADVDLAISIAALSKIFNVITQLWLSQKSEVVMAATHAIEVLLRDALGPVCMNTESVQEYKQKIMKCFDSISLGLGYQYHHAWHQILHVIAVMFEIGGCNCADLLKKTLKGLSELRDSYKFSFNNELEHAVGAAVRSMGPKIVLNVIPLQKENGELNLDRSWLIPVLKENVRNSTLDFWMQRILPLATYCQKRSVELSGNNDGSGAHSAELLHLQFWNLLPSFCNEPSDISEHFKSIAKVLGMGLSERKELRVAIMASLRKLITSAKDSENDEDIAEISRFDKNYLPILFNVYTTKPIGSDEEGQRLAALETIKVYLTVTKPDLTKQLFDNALERVENITDPEELYLKESILDLIRALVPYQPSENIEKLFNQCIKNLISIKNNKEQKKAYRLLEEICGSSADGSVAFLRSNTKIVQLLLTKSLSTAAVSSKGARLRCLNYLIKAQPKLNHECNLVKLSIPEAILCCKDINHKCREAAYELLNTIGDILQNQDQMTQFLTMLMSGLVGNPQLISATILALSSILHNFTGALGQENIALILENIMQLITVPTREIVASCLSFIKVFSTSLPSPTVAANLPKIVKSLCSMNEDCKRHFRLKVRNLIDRLVRKYGCDSIQQHVPASDTIMHKRLRNIRKLHNRVKRQNQLEHSKMETDNDQQSEDFLIKSKPKSIEDILADSDSEVDQPEDKIKNKNPYKAYIEEDANTIIDFKDPTVISKITAMKPNVNGPSVTSKKMSKDRGFKTAADGRLIIQDHSSDDSGDDTTKKSSKFNFDSNSDSDSNDAISSAATQILRDRKRKRSTQGSVASSLMSSAKYKPGGSGIHRNVGASTSSTNKESTGQSKAKKASGDVKTKGKLDPYAYVPLQRSTLNKRKKHKHIGEFKNIISAAKSGAKKGMKANRKKH